MIVGFIPDGSDNVTEGVLMHNIHNRIETHGFGQFMVDVVDVALVVITEHEVIRIVAD